MTTPLEIMKADMAELSKKGSSVSDHKSEYLKFPEGDTVIRILPGTPEMNGLFYVKQHYHTHQMGGKPEKVQCTIHTTGQCAICRAIAPKQFAASKEDRDQWYGERSKAKFFFNVLDRADGKVKVWEASATMFGEVAQYATDEDFGDISDPVNGHDLVVNRKGTGFGNTKYSLRAKPKKTPLVEHAALADVLAARAPIHRRLEPIDPEPQKLWWVGGWDAAKAWFSERKEGKTSQPAGTMVGTMDDEDIPDFPF